MKKITMAVASAAVVMTGISAYGTSSPSCRIVWGHFGPNGDYAGYAAEVTLAGGAQVDGMSVRVYDVDGQLYSGPRPVVEPRDSAGNPMSVIPAGQSVTAITIVSAAKGDTCQVSGG